jgi:hypothetical protein
MNIFNIIILFLTLFNSNISPDNVSVIADVFGIVIENNETSDFLYESDYIGNFVMTYDENFKLYMNDESNLVMGLYKLFYHDTNIHAQILFSDNKPLVLSIHIINSLINNIETINGIRNIVFSLGHKIDSWGSVYGGDVHYVFHVYPKEILAILVGPINDRIFTNYSELKVLYTGRHPLPGKGTMSL